jgi:hypothetical protein
VTPQSAFFVLARIEDGRADELRRLLETMNAAPGQADPLNGVVTFADYETLHFARFCIIDDKTTGDVSAYGLEPIRYAPYLVFLGDVDGDARRFLDDVATRSERGLRSIFASCSDFGPTTDLRTWMRRHSVRAATTYVNWRGRTLRRLREEAALCAAVERYLGEHAAILGDLPPQQLRMALRHFLSGEIAAARLAMTPDAPTNLGWLAKDVLYMLAVPLCLIIASPILLIVGAIVLLSIRAMERTDPQMCPRVDASWNEALARLEDRDVTNAFTALGSLKPGLVRRWTAAFVLWFLDYAMRYAFARGRLARVRTIHFARWVFLDGKRRLLFASNYDGSLESYMDDFINKAGFGLNLVFSNGIGYPKTRWLVAAGSADEQKFKSFLRRHQQPTEVWYNAHPGLTAVDLERNMGIREGLEAPVLSDRDASRWAALL